MKPDTRRSRSHPGSGTGSEVSSRWAVHGISGEQKQGVGLIQRKFLGLQTMPEYRSFKVRVSKPDAQSQISKSNLEGGSSNLVLAEYFFLKSPFNLAFVHFVLYL